MHNRPKNYKRSGTYYRNVQKKRDMIYKKAIEANHSLIGQKTIQFRESDVLMPSIPPVYSDVNESISIPQDVNHHIDTAKIDANLASSLGDESNLETTRKLKTHLREWGIKHQIKHTAMKDLVNILNTDMRIMLPEDPRTLLRTPKEVVITRIGNGGSYWHYGLEKCLQCAFTDLKEPKTISLNINMDGLPIFKSSKVEFWPILCSIHEIPELPVMVIGIYCGTTKTNDLESFLTPFVTETKEIMNQGLSVNSHKITVRIRCIICDSPARAYIKGVANFNAQEGCLKCTTVGEFSYVSNTNIFPRTICEKRTDAKFRQKLYGAHHKYDSPMLQLNIDMVEQFPVSDCLHLLHLGVMKRFLFGWRDGTFRLSNTKWPAKTTIEVSAYLKECKMPAEIHRTVRGLDCLTHWKGTEYRTFLHYIGIVILKDNLTKDAYVHFCLLFCATTICTSQQYHQLLPTARAMLLQFLETFAEIYGQHHLTSNVHNLSHIVDEVERFGLLDSFSAYPFENALGKIKRLIRSGNLPLSQVAKRVVENFNCTMDSTQTSKNSNEPTLSKRNDGTNVPDVYKTEENSFYDKIQFKNVCYGTDSANCWLLTNDKKIFMLKNIIFEKNKRHKLCCVEIKEKHNFFTIPLESKRLNIYCVEHFEEYKQTQINIIEIHAIKCKMVCLKYHNQLVFIPLLHSL